AVPSGDLKELKCVSMTPLWLPLHTPAARWSRLVRRWRARWGSTSARRLRVGPIHAAAARHRDSPAPRMEKKMSIPTGDNAFLYELERNVRAELTQAETSPPEEEAVGVPIDEWLSDPADAQRYEVGLRNLLGAAEA